MTAGQQPVANVRVASATLANLALSSLTPKPVASVDFTTTNTSPAQMIDGTTTSGGWTNTSGSASFAQGGDWAAVSWPSAQLIKSLNIYFTQSATRSVPNSTTSPIEIDAWDGREYVPVSYQPFTYPAGPNTTTPTTITLTNPVQTSKLRVWMASSAPLTASGWIQIQELQAMGDQVTASNVASLSSISLNGVPLAGFSAGTTTYSVGVNPSKVPVITATAASNGSVSIQTPQSSPGTATITVTSEDGTATQTYTLSLVPDTTPPVTTASINGVAVPPNGTLTVTAPAVLTLSAVDPGTPSGVAATYYSVNQPKGVGGILYTPGSPAVIDPLNGNTSTGGQITLRWWSVDNAGNIEDPSATVLILPDVPTTVSGNVPSTLGVSVGSTAPSLGAFAPGVAATYATSIGALVTTTAATSTFTAADTSTVFPGHLVNTAASGGPYALAQGLQVDATDTSGSSTGGGVFSDLSHTNPATLLSFAAPVSNDPITVGFKQAIGATDPLRTGTYTKTITLTLSTNTP